jgi:hypothetical protein
MNYNNIILQLIISTINQRHAFKFKELIQQCAFWLNYEVYLDLIDLQVIIILRGSAA